MGETFWGERAPGQTFVSEPTETEDGYGIMVAQPADTDWMKLPADVDPGQRERRVTERYTSLCPLDPCNPEGRKAETHQELAEIHSRPDCCGIVLHFGLEGGFYVAECQIHQFVIYRRDDQSAAQAIAAEQGQ